MSTIPNQPVRIPMVDPRTGIVTREWLRFFEGLFQRVGGNLGLSTTDVDAGTFAAVQPAYSPVDQYSDISQCAGSAPGESVDISQQGAGCCDLPDITQ